MLETVRGVIIGGVWALAGCGAQSKPMTGGMSAKALGEKATEICADLKSRFSPAELDMAACATAGSEAFNFSDGINLAQQMRFTTESVTEGGEKLLRVSLRTEYWLNNNIINLAQRLNHLLKEKQGLAVDKMESFSSDEKAVAGGLISLKYGLSEPFQFDPGSSQATAKIRLQMSGMASVDNTISLGAHLFATGVGASFSTVSDAPFSQSLVRRMAGVVLVIPHANDIYVGITLSASMYSLGFDKTIDETVRNVMGPALAGLGKLIPRLTP